MARNESCGACAFYVAPKPVPDDGRVVDSAARVFTHGVCKRYPQALEKPPSDWCGEFLDGDNHYDRRIGYQDQGESDAGTRAAGDG